jgi:hypothetical protein
VFKEKRPREYAAEIASLETREQKLAALNAVPEALRPMVVSHLKIAAFYLSKRESK